VKRDAVRWRDDWQRSNIIAARVILEHPETFSELQVSWARRVVEKDAALLQSFGPGTNGKEGVTR
jgi:hypothetical protein